MPEIVNEVTVIFIAESHIYRTNSQTLTQELDISQNKIGKVGSDAIFSMLLENTTVQKLVLDRCDLKNDAISGMIVPLAQAHKVSVCLAN